MTITTNSPEQTELLGKKLAARLNPGDVIAYYGDLGAGKTAFTRGLAAGLGVTECVTSPTYTIVNEYLSGACRCFTLTCTGFPPAKSCSTSAGEDYLARGGVCAVEWSENVEDALEGAIAVTIEKDPVQPDRRSITIEGGARFEALGI